MYLVRHHSYDIHAIAASLKPPVGGCKYGHQGRKTWRGYGLCCCSDQGQRFGHVTSCRIWHDLANVLCSHCQLI